MQNYAISLLLNNSFIQANNLENLTLHWGYIFTKTDGMLEAIFKIIYEERIFYFGIQNGNMTLININEQQYNEIIDYMKKNHECLNNINETEQQKNRRIKNNQYLIENNITANVNLLCYINDDNITIKSIDEICKRAIACLITIQIACDINNGNYKEALDFFIPLYKKYGVENNLTSKEKRIVNGNYNRQDIIDMDWCYESYWTLCWCLGLVDDIKNASVLCDCNKAISIFKSSKSFDEFKSKCKIRSINEILDMHDLYFRYNWAINNKKIDESTSIGNLNISNVIERRRALEWIISSENDWSNILLNT